MTLTKLQAKLNKRLKRRENRKGCPIVIIKSDPSLRAWHEVRQDGLGWKPRK